MLEEEELGQLGVLDDQTDSATEFGLRAKWRLESMKAFVRQESSARLARSRLRKPGPIDMERKAGDLIMSRKAEGPRTAAAQGEHDLRASQNFGLTWCWALVSPSARSTSSGSRDSSTASQTFQVNGVRAVKQEPATTNP